LNYEGNQNILTYSRRIFNNKIVFVIVEFNFFLFHSFECLVKTFGFESRGFGQVLAFGRIKIKAVENPSVEREGGYEKKYQKPYKFSPEFSRLKKVVSPNPIWLE